MPLAPGARLGPYEIEAAIGKGGMGEVYRARDTRLGRAVAIQIVNAPFSERFVREARAISALNHPHVCTLYDVGSFEGTGYLVMELVEGEPLRGPMPWKDAVRHVADVCVALNAAHRKGIVHRDLKPGNVLLTPLGVKVIDFGLAKQDHAGETTVAGATPENYQGRVMWALLLAVEGRRADALQVMDADVLKGGELIVAAPLVAEVYAVLGDRAKALEWLDRHVRAGDERADWFERDPLLANLRQESGFRRIVDGIRYRQQQRKTSTR